MFLKQALLESLHQPSAVVFHCSSLTWTAARLSPKSSLRDTVVFSESHASSSPALAQNSWYARDSSSFFLLLMWWQTFLIQEWSTQGVTGGDKEALLRIALWINYLWMVLQGGGILAGYQTKSDVQTTQLYWTHSVAAPLNKLVTLPLPSSWECAQLLPMFLQLGTFSLDLQQGKVFC